MGNQSKNIILGISAGIAAYRMYDLVSDLKKLGHNVTVVLTKDSRNFVSELPFKVLSSNPVFCEMFSPALQSKPVHIDLADSADIVLVSPATADIIAKMANGICDELITNILLATKAPVYIAPAMNTNMWEHFTTQKNIETLVTKLGYKIIPPEEGDLACGYSGIGHIATNEKIIKTILYGEIETKPLLGKKVLITAGGTREPIDPVRFIGNKSSGKMGLSIADVAYSMGANVLLISSVSFERKYPVVEVDTAQEMQEVIESEFDKSDALIMAAAVSDFRPVLTSKQKIKKKNEDLTLELTRNPDILEILGRTKRDKQIIIGFSAESENIEKNAQEKLEKKKIDMIVANDITVPEIGFDSDENAVIILTQDGHKEVLQRQLKIQIARHICNKLVDMFKALSVSLLLCFYFCFPSFGLDPSLLIGKKAKSKTEEKATEEPKKKVINEADYEPILLGSILDKPEEFIGKKIKIKGKFSSFTTLALDYEGAMRKSKDYISLCIFRPDSKIPLSELKLAYPVKDAKEDPIIRELEEGDVLEINGEVFSAALSEPWVDIITIKILEHGAKSLENKLAQEKEKPTQQTSKGKVKKGKTGESQKTTK